MSVSIVKRNNVLAGFFVIASLVLAVAIAAILGDVLGNLGAKNEFVVRFPTEIGVTGLEAGAEVTFAGLPVGRVTSITPYRSGGDATPADAMDVTVLVDARVTLFEDAFADLAPPILGGVSRINFASAGAGPVARDAKAAALARSNGNGVLEPGEIVRGRFAPSILAQLGFTAEDAERIRNAIADVEAITANVRTTTDRVDRMAARLEPTFDQTLADAGEAVANAKEFTLRFGEDGWASRIENILADAEQTVAEGPRVAADVRGAIASARAMIETHSDSVGRLLGNAESITERVRFDTMDQAESLLREGTLAAASFRAVGEQTDTMLAGLRPDIRAATANTRGITQQARLFLDEIRAQPWRLLKQPGKDDLMREPLYAATRAYADAVSDLRIASEALDAAIQNRNADTAPTDAALEVARIAATVQAAYDRYAQTERALLETLQSAQP
jgi:ABC-type transporter Mla subunit MlaD